MDHNKPGNTTNANNKSQQQRGPERTRQDMPTGNAGNMGGQKGGHTGGSSQRQDRQDRGTTGSSDWTKK